MDAFRVIQISDTHLSRAQSWFRPNFEAMVGIVSAHRPDLVVNTGDISLDGVDREDDLAFSHSCHAMLAAPLRTIPGNHDVGDNPWRPGLDHAITDERLTRYRRYFGEDYWLVEAGAWILVGVNAQLLGSGLAAEAGQWSFLASARADAGDRPLALFVHKPLFDRDPTETDVNHRFVTPDNRRRLLDVLHGANLRLVASGHVHQHRCRRVAEVDHCWAPSTAYVLPDRKQPLLGTKRVGYVAYTFRPTGIDIEIMEAPELTNHNLDDFQFAQGA